MKKILLFATSNKEKESEITKIIGDIERYEIKFLSNFDEIKIAPPEENGLSFEENSLLKCKYYKKFFNDFFVAAEDSGLLVDALDGAPGIYSARFKSLENDLEKVELIIKMLENVPWEKRMAKFFCVITLIEPQGKTVTFFGEVEGKIAFEKKGENGFGYDPIFIPEREKRTFAEMSAEEKNWISHRRRALVKLKEYLVG